jgi:DNA-binding protein H-NS
VPLQSIPKDEKEQSMATYSELMAQAQNLMAQAEQARKTELAGVIADIKARMKQYGITVADLGGAGAGGGAKRAAKPAAAPKYRGPNGELWAGGPGRKPQWVRDVLAAGKNLDSYRI